MGDAIDERVTQFSVDWALSERETEALHDLLAEVRAETEARVVEAAAQVCRIRRQMYEGDLERALGPESRTMARIRIGVAAVLEGDIRALTPADYVAVRRDDFEVIAGAAYAALDDNGWEHCVDRGHGDRIRAALARAKGE